VPLLKGKGNLASTRPCKCTRSISYSYSCTGCLVTPDTTKKKTSRRDPELAGGSAAAGASVAFAGRQSPGRGWDWGHRRAMISIDGRCMGCACTRNPMDGCSVPALALLRRRGADVMQRREQRRTAERSPSCRVRFLIGVRSSSG
jgi:hypothetical protein